MMAKQEKPSANISDSPTGWVSKHIREYVETDGKKGHRWQGQNTLLLTTTGRKSGKRRRTALIYSEDNGNYIVVGSNGGKDKHPAWYLNVLDNPTVDVQVAADRFSANARTATGEERAHLWQLVTTNWPTYKTFQKKTDREIPIVILAPKR
jgi:deazaflavin-dependent oxidoreductase (nitroreductase family)